MAPSSAGMLPPRRPSPEATAAVRLATRSALRAEVGLVVAPALLGSVAPVDFLAAARRHRVTGVLAQQAAALDLPPEVRLALDEGRPRSRIRSLRQVRCLAEVARVLERGGIAALFFKGPCLAVQTTGDFSARDAGDIDVLVAASNVSAAVRSLELAGWTRKPGSPSDDRSFGWRYLIWGSCELSLGGPLGAVDLHWRLDPTREGLPGFEELWSRRCEVDVGGVAFASLGLEDAVRHSCHHAAKDGWLWLRSLVDVHRLLRESALPPQGDDAVVDATVAVVDALVGLPLRAVRDRASPRRAPGPVRAALRAQDRPVREHRPAGLNTYRSVRFALASGHGATNALHTLAVAVIPPSSFAGNDARTAPAALVRAMPGRVGRVVLRVLGRLESSEPVPGPEASPPAS